MASIAAEAGLSSFIQAFSAVDAMGSRRRREKLLDARLEEEREFRAANLEFAQSREQRAQEDHEESQEERELRLEADAIGLDPDSTDEELRQAALRSPIAIEAIDHRRGFKAFVGLTDSIIAQRQNTQVQPGAQAEPTQVTAQPRNEFQVAGLPAAATTREVRRDEIVAQTGFRIDPLMAGAGGSKFVEVSGDFKTRKELDAMPDQKEAKAILDRQKAELIEADPRSPTARVERIKDASKRKITNDVWKATLKVSDPGGDTMRQQMQDNPSAAVSQYWRDRPNLDAATQQAADKLMVEPVKRSLVENRLVLEDPELDLTGRDANNARRKIAKALGVAQAASIDTRPARDAGIRSDGIPQGNEELANLFFEASKAAPKAETTLSPNKLRQAITQVTRNFANPTKRANDEQLRNLYLLAQDGQITPADMLYAASHGGALPAPAGEKPRITTVSPKDNMYLTYADGRTVLIQAGSDPDDPANRNLLEGAGGQILRDLASQYDTADHKNRGKAFLGAFLAGLRLHEDEATAAGFAFSNPLDVAQLFQAYGQEMLVKNELNSQWWEKGDFLPEYEDHIAPDVWASIFSGAGRQFLKGKAGEGILNEFSDFQIDPVGGGVAGLRQAAAQSNDPAFQQKLDSMTNAQVEQLIVQDALAKQAGR